MYAAGKYQGLEHMLRGVSLRDAYIFFPKLDSFGADGSNIEWYLQPLSLVMGDSP